MPETIYFYRVSEEYGEFSNFTTYPIVLGGKIWPTSEHYFQAQKFAGTRWAEKIRLAKSPKEAARLGRDRGKPLRKNWEEIKEDVMRIALQAKFTQFFHLQNMLLGTGDKILVEHTKNDSYWGDGGDESGKNRLGVLLMELREKLRKEYE